MKRSILLAGSIAILGAAGCGSQDTEMSATERAQFAGGGPTAARSPQQQQAMNDFIAEFKKSHPRPSGPSEPSGAPPH